MHKSHTKKGRRNHSGSLGVGECQAEIVEIREGCLEEAMFALGFEK